MENKMTARSALSAVLVFVLAAVLLLGLNAKLAPLAEQNNNAAVLAPLFEVLPEAKGFTCLYDAEAPEASGLVVAAETVRAIYADTDGSGYAITLSTCEGYTKQPMELTAGFTADGKVAAIQINSYPDTKEMGADYPLSYVGQDSAMAEVELVAGVTYSSGAFKNAVNDAFAALIDNGLITAGQKDDDQLLLELVTTLVPGMANASGIGQYEQSDASGSYIYSTLTAMNGSSCAFLAKDGGQSYLLAVNSFGVVRAFDTEGTDVTESAPAAMLEEAAQNAVVTGATQKEETKLLKLAGLADTDATLEAVALDTFNSAVAAYKIIPAEGDVLYGIILKPYGYSNIVMTYYFVLDESGTIAGMNADELILHKDYFSSYTLEESDYKAGFAGLTADTYTGEEALITGATFSGSATDTATKDAFAAMDCILENGGQNNG